MSPSSPPAAARPETPEVATRDAQIATRDTQIAQNLLCWFRQHQRDMPWRKTRDPYAIWISETMLQQTLVATVVGFWTRWMERFPTVEALAEADIADVLKMWQGLGYYARARNLHRAAQVIRDQHDGTFPTNFDDVLALPGVGRYTAGAVCSIAFGQDVPLVDANVVRVLCRVDALAGDPKSPVVQKTLWRRAEELIPTGDARDFNQSLMELGALVCTPTKPRCAACPISEHCRAFQSGEPTAYPQHAPRPTFTTQTDVCAIIAQPDEPEAFLLVRRPLDGLWGGLWEFPRVTASDGESVGEAAIRAAREVVGLAVAPISDDGDEIAAQVRHGVTTRKITLCAVLCEQTDRAFPQLAECIKWRWARLAKLDALALSTPQVRLVEKLRATETQPTLF